MSYTQADLDALNSAIGRGASKVRMGDEEVTFRSLDEMYRIRADIERSLGSVRVTHVNPYFDRGI